jgi:hypothetical protein
VAGVTSLLLLLLLLLPANVNVNGDVVQGVTGVWTGEVPMVLMLAHIYCMSTIHIG